MAAAGGASAFGSREFGKVTLLGNPGVGKTCIVKKFCYNKYQEQYKVTLGADFGTKQINVDGVMATAQVWDTAGQERFNSMGPAFYRGSDACVLVYDVTDPKSLTGLAEWKRTFLEQAHVDDDDFPFVVVGNKCDLPAHEHVVTEEDGQNWADTNGCIEHFWVSAKDNINIEQAFQAAMRHVLRRKKARDEVPVIPDRVDISAPAADDGGCKC